MIHFRILLLIICCTCNFRQNRQTPRATQRGLENRNCSWRSRIAEPPLAVDIVRQELTWALSFENQNPKSVGADQHLIAKLGFNTTKNLPSKLWGKPARSRPLPPWVKQTSALTFEAAPIRPTELAVPLLPTVCVRPTRHTDRTDKNGLIYRETPRPAKTSECSETFPPALCNNIMEKNTARTYHFWRQQCKLWSEPYLKQTGFDGICLSQT